MTSINGLNPQNLKIGDVVRILEGSKIYQCGVIKRLPWYDGSSWVDPYFLVSFDNGDLRSYTSVQINRTNYQEDTTDYQEDTKEYNVKDKEDTDWGLIKDRLINLLKATVNFLEVL